MANINKHVKAFTMATGVGTVGGMLTMTGLSVTGYFMEAARHAPTAAELVKNLSVFAFVGLPMTLGALGATFAGVHVTCKDHKSPFAVFSGMVTGVAGAILALSIGFNGATKEEAPQESASSQEQQICTKKLIGVTKHYPIWTKVCKPAVN